MAINCGVWRYHPTRAVFEAVAHGTTNPWGLDFDDLGEAFITNCVIPHLFHVVPGAHFQRMYGEDLAPHRYALMETCADHIHWAGGLWTDSREGKGKHGEAGGGHAHVGAMIYLGDNWPDRYRNDVFTCNIHGKRINRDRLERRGSGYVARHEPDFLMANDTWFRGLELKYGPDGAVYMTDWYDTGECHENDADNAHRENGRIYKISHGTPQPVTVDLAGLDDEALAQLQLHHNDWYVRTARRLLQERAAAGRDLSKAHRLLRDDPGGKRRRDPPAAGALGPVRERRPRREGRPCACSINRASMSGRGASGCSAIRAAGAGHGGAIRGAGQDRPQPESPAEPGLGPAATAAERALGGRRTAGEPQGRRLGRDAPLDDLVWSRTARAGRSTTGRGARVRLRRFRSCAGSWPAAPWRPTRRPAWPPLSHCSSRRTTRLAAIS